MAGMQTADERDRLLAEQVVQHPPGKPYVDKRREATIKIPFRRDEMMEGDPSCSAADLLMPRLRRSTFDAAQIDWNRLSLLGAGRDGCVWKVWFGDDGPYALKVVSRIIYHMS